MSDSNAYLLGMTRTLEDMRSKVSKQYPDFVATFENLMACFEGLKLTSVDTFEETKVLFETELLELGKHVK